MTAIRTKYLWKRCSHCGETTVCREVSQCYLLIEGPMATRIFDGPAMIGETGYLCRVCDPEANPPELEATLKYPDFHDQVTKALVRAQGELPDLRIPAELLESLDRTPSPTIAESDATGTP